ncbi:MAG: poly-beta-hydroxybutyrate polymerase, partial [Acidimicrobiales bacterium]
MERLLNVIDPVGLGRASARAMTSVALRPGATLEPSARFVGGLIQASAATACRLVGIDAEGPLAPTPKDGRFDDEAWSHNASFYGL